MHKLCGRPLSYHCSVAELLGHDANTLPHSVYGKRLYEKNGFVFKEQVEVAVPGATDRPSGAFAWLERPEKSS